MTVEEKFNEYFKTFPRYGTYLAEDWKKEIISIATNFGREKCQELLEIVAEKASVGMSWGYEGGTPDILGSYSKRLKYIVDKDSILNAVDLNKFIK